MESEIYDGGLSCFVVGSKVFATLLGEQNDRIELLCLVEGGLHEAAHELRHLVVLEVTKLRVLLGDHNELEVGPGLVILLEEVELDDVVEEECPETCSRLVPLDEGIDIEELDLSVHHVKEGLHTLLRELEPQFTVLLDDVVVFFFRVVG